MHHRMTRTALAALPLLAVSISGAQAQTSWLLGGNSGTNAANDFLGTKDSVSLNLRVNNQRALLIEPTRGTPNLIGGFSGNGTVNGPIGAFIGGGGFLSRENTVGANYGTIGGGAYNRVGASSGSPTSQPYATVSGGYSNQAMGNAAVVAGGINNRATDAYTTVGGGTGNIASGERSTIGGGIGNVSGGVGATVAGGIRNLASSSRATIGGGSNNSAQDNATVSGGTSNAAIALSSSVGGGQSNKASGAYATIGGGQSNQTIGAHSTVIGGFANVAEGVGSTVLGGVQNEATGDNSLGAGFFAKAMHKGAFVWADVLSSPSPSFSSTAANQFSARATGGVRFISGVNGSGEATTGVQLAPGSGSWSMLSDRNAKSGNAAANVDAVLDALMKVSIEYWSYKTQNGVRHIGPMAQDFKKAFNVGETDTMISSVDADGVAFAAIQALKIKLDALEAKNSALQKENATLKSQVTNLQTSVEARLSALESGR